MLQGDEFDDSGEVALTEVAVDVVDNLIYIRLMSRQLAHFLGYTRKNIHISFTGAAAVFLYLAVDKEVIEVAGEVKSINKISLNSKIVITFNNLFRFIAFSIFHHHRKSWLTR